MSPDSVTTETLLPDLFRRLPNARPVFDRYGLAGCGGPAGPVETVGFFARTHGVPAERLLAEIREAAAGEAAPPARPWAAHAIYRPYFTAGLLIVLGAGAAWGGWLLWSIAANGSMTGVPIQLVNAHGHAMVFGWVALFIMGFAYQALPRMWHTPLAGPRLAVAVFASMVAGLVLVTGGWLLNSGPAALALAATGSACHGGAITVFAIQLWVTWRRSDVTMEPWLGFVFVALGWFLVQAVYAGWHQWEVLAASNRGERILQVATHQAPLRYVQLHGLTLFMILGVSIRMLPALFGVRAGRPAAAWVALGLLTVAVTVQVGAFITYQTTGSRYAALLLYGAWVSIAVGVALVGLPWRLWRPPPELDRSAKFVRAAYAWLAVALLLLLAVPVNQALTGQPFSHAYYGATRHAFTVGFITLMIMGFASRVVPTLNGVDPRSLTGLWGPFLLVNAGCGLRVVSQTLSDVHAGFFHPMVASAALEAGGLTWWAAGLLLLMYRGQPQPACTCCGTGEQAVTLRPPRILADHKVADVLRWFPETEAVFAGRGFTALRHPMLRRTVATVTAIRQAAALGGVNLDDLLDDLNAAAGRRQPAGSRG